MDNKEPKIDTSSVGFDDDNFSNDYKFLVEKLKKIKEIINLLEKNFLK